MAEILVLSEGDSSGNYLCECLESLGHRTRILECDQFYSSSWSSSNEITLGIECTVDGLELVILNLEKGSSTTIDIIERFKHEKGDDFPVIVVTGEVPGADVIETMKCGAFDHLIRPVSLGDMKIVMERALTKRAEYSSLEPFTQEFLVGLSPVMRHIQKTIGVAASSDATVLIQGESGTGKGTVARSIHRHSAHQHQPFSVVDCTAIPEEYQSFASLLPGSKGTVLLDELGDLNERMQAVLLRSLKEWAAREEHQADLRIIATTQYDLSALVKQKRFREDLFYRLSVLTVTLPPLRERGSDILALAEIFLQQALPQSPKQLATDAAKALLDYAWPGNVRELQNLMHHLSLTVRSTVIDKTDLVLLDESHKGRGASADSRNELQDLDFHACIGTLEKELLRRALEQTNGNRAEAARVLGINRQLLYAKLKEHGIRD